MTTFHRLAIAIGAMSFFIVLGCSLLLAGRRVDVTLQKSVALSSDAGARGNAGLRVHFQRDASGYRLTKEGWISKSFDGQEFGGDAALVVDSRR